MVDAMFGGERLEGSEVCSILDALGYYQDTQPIAQEIGVDWRDVSNWCAKGCDGAPAAYLRLALRLKRHAMPWRANEVPIRWTESGFEIGKPGALV